MNMDDHRRVLQTAAEVVQDDNELYTLQKQYTQSYSSI